MSQKVFFMEKKTPRVDLNIYLLKAGATVAAAIKHKGVNSQDIKIDGKAIGTLHVKAAHANPPKWARFFQSVIASNQFGKNSSTGALLVMHVNDQLFILAFGQGRHLLESEFIEMDFGLKVTLNLVNEHSLRSIDKASFEAHPRLSREQAGKSTDLQYFMLDVERDLLRALTGEPVDPFYGERISGMDSVKLSLEITLAEVTALLVRLRKAYSNIAYKKKGFAFVDHIKHLRDTELCDQLDSTLMTQLGTPNPEKVWLSVPEIVDWDKAVGFKYSHAKSAARFYDVRLSDFKKEIGKDELDKSVLMRRKILCVDSDDQSVLERPAYYYLYAEVMHEHKMYLLNAGKWYLIDHDFVAQTNSYYEKVPKYQKALPQFEDKTEGEYNSRVAKTKAKEFALLDQDNVHLPGALSPIEPCDLYRNPKEFIHIKRYGGSSLLSHLFNQGVVAGELFKREQAFRQQLNKKLPPRHRLDNVNATPKDHEYKIVYAVISEYDGDLSIPFFSKVTLRHAIGRLTSLGFAVELAKISVSQETKVLQVIPAAQ